MFRKFVPWWRKQVDLIEQSWRFLSAKDGGNVSFQACALGLACVCLCACAWQNGSSLLVLLQSFVRAVYALRAWGCVERGNFCFSIWERVDEGGVDLVGLRHVVAAMLYLYEKGTEIDETTSFCDMVMTKMGSPFTVTRARFQEVVVASELFMTFFDIRLRVCLFV